MIAPLAADRSAFLLFIPATMAATWLGGTLAGVLALVAGGILGQYFFVPEAFHIATVADPMALFFYVATAGLTVILVAYAKRRWDAVNLLRELRESEERYRRLVELSPDAVFVHDGQRILFANAATLRIFGASDSAQLLKRTPLDLVHPESQPDVEQCIERLLAETDGLATATEQKAVRMDGTPFDYEASAARVIWRGTPAIVVMLRDTTERKQAEAALRASESRFAKLSASGLVGICTSSLHGKIVEANDAYLNIIGFTREEMLRGEIDWRKITPPEYLPLDEYAIEQLKTYGVCEPFEKAYVRRDGTRVYVLLGLLVLDRVSELALVFVLDVTKRKRAEEVRDGQSRVLRLMASGHNLDDVLRTLIGTIEQQCPEIIASILLLDEEEKRIAKVLAPSLPDAVSTLLGIDIGPTVGSFATAALLRERIVIEDIETDLFWAPFRETARAYGLRACLSQPIFSADKRLMGTIALYYRRPHVPNEFEIELIESAAHLAGLAIGRHLAETALHQAKDAAETASRYKDHFLTMLSHELRTPLTPALAAATMLERSPQLPGELQEETRVIRRSIELEARLIDDLLDLTRINRGKLELHLQEIDLRAALEQALQICSVDFDAKHLQVIREIQSGDYRLRGDSTRLQQVFWNLLKNAVKFTPCGGSVTVRCRANRRGQAVVEFADTGIGISSDVLPRLFNVFEQGGRTITRQFGGLGVGLALCKAVVELHGGEIGARSAGPGKGATFRVVLPLLPLDQRAAKPTAERSYATHEGDLFARKCCKVLLVEDHPETARIMSRMLSSHGHDVRVAESVASALRLSEEETFDVLVTDLGLPDGSGIDLVNQLRAKRIDIPAIALSGYGMEVDACRSIQAGFAEHLVKPLDIRALKAAISRVAR